MVWNRLFSNGMHHSDRSRNNFTRNDTQLGFGFIEYTQIIVYYYRCCQICGMGFFFGLAKYRKLFSEGQIVWIIYCWETAHMCLWNEVSSNDISQNDKQFNPYFHGSINDRNHTHTHTFHKLKKIKTIWYGWMLGRFYTWNLKIWWCLFNCYYLPKCVELFEGKSIRWRRLLYMAN